MPGKTQAITDGEWAAVLKSDGLEARSPKAANQPISDSEWSALKSQHQEGGKYLVPTRWWNRLAVPLSIIIHASVLMRRSVMA
ncbi:hypothetical protein PG995_012684 [Apiospora arundinis]|uniref:Transposase n=1 Tax=Apiospora arundinis TaxID=335852 RepID=A0ABR2I4E3_9PEZI